MEHIGAMLGGRLFQIGIVVADLDAGLRRSADIVGEQRWRCYDFGQVGRHEYHGRATTCSLRLALNDASPQMELIQPFEGDSIHRDWPSAARACTTSGSSSPRSSGRSRRWRHSASR
jgi:Glyoxalase/Bleomycin resistance protein/Dioxygenase superfamily